MSAPEIPAEKIVEFYSRLFEAITFPVGKFHQAFHWGVQQFVPISTFAYVADPLFPDPPSQPFQPASGYAVRLNDRTLEGKTVTSVTDYKVMEQGRSAHPIEQAFQASLAVFKQHVAEKFPNYVALHQFQLRMEEYPRLILGFFRIQLPDHPDCNFTAEERELLEKMKLHFSNILRAFDTVQKARDASFNFFHTTCNEIAGQFRLTVAEYQVLVLVVEGCTNEEIAQRQSVSIATVRTHLKHILQKTGCKNRFDLFRNFFSSAKSLHRRDNI
ncbi:MAG: LuxR family transcriptional regulator [Chlorobi bacterium CHB2]|nr:LuxR family transcriptional regulator [Chlorobi bacterium CHB2]